MPRNSRKVTADFSASVTEVVESFDAFSLVICILEKETTKIRLLRADQLMTTEGALQDFSAILDDTCLSGSDQLQLTVIVRSQWSDDAEKTS